MATIPSVSMDFMLRQFDLTYYDSYHEYMRGFLLHALSTTDKTPDTVLFELQMVNKSIYEYMCKAAIRNQFDAEHSGQK